MKKLKAHTKTTDKPDEGHETAQKHSISRGVLSLGAAVVAVCGMLFGGLLTYMWADYTDIVGKQRAEFQKLVEENEKAYASVYDQIGTLWLVASGHKNVSDEDRQKLKNRIQKLYWQSIEYLKPIQSLYPLQICSLNR